MQTFINMPPQICNNACKFSATSLELLLLEPSLLSATPAHVRKDGGIFAKQILEQLEKIYERDITSAEKHGLSAIVDVRVQRLMPDMYPSIPGWHCDAVPRNSYHGQPDFSMINPRSFHVALTHSSEYIGVSNTEYVIDTIRPKIFDEEHVYRNMHEYVEGANPHKCKVNDRFFVKFWPKTIHRATPCHRRGVRMFFRYSMYEKPPIKNVVVSQQQVYLLSEKNGW